MSAILPPSKSVNVSALSRLFDNTTNSYKLVFFQALLNLFGQRLAENVAHIYKLREIAIEMAAFAWVPHAFFRLSFGLQDQMGRSLDALYFSVEEHGIARAETQERLREAISAQYDAMDLVALLRFVPYRLLSPFFEESLRGKPDHIKNELIRSKAEQAFNCENPALYRFIDDSDDGIELHPDWVSYLGLSLPIITGWVRMHWVEYLQGRNPNTPAIPCKIAPPLSRSALSRQTAYWRAIMEVSPIRCLYTNEVLEIDRFALDHFIPWSFVCHDQLWNLFPVLPEANSAKGNRLPANRYVDGFINLQAEGLRIASRHLSPRAWDKVTECFVSDLRVGQNELLIPERLRDAYRATLSSMITLAGQTGFATNWAYEGSRGS